MYHKNQLDQQQKESILADAKRTLARLQGKFKAKISDYLAKVEEQKDLVPELKSFNLNALDGDSEQTDKILSKVKLYTERAEQYSTLSKSPYFLRLDRKDTEGNVDTIYIGKYSSIDDNIYSWVAPIATLRYGGIGKSTYTTPRGENIEADIARKDDFMITNSEINFMTHEAVDTPRQVIYQKHINERRQFLLPEIVAELDRLQDKIIRSDPSGHMLISGPAGSGKTTLALHRIAYLVLTPEFRGFFEPEKIIVFVNDDRAISYFSSLLPELGINGVKVVTYHDWSLMIVNSRYRTKLTNRFKHLTTEAAITFIGLNNPIPGLHPRLVLEQYRKLKQQVIMPLHLNEGKAQSALSALSEHYLSIVETVPAQIQNAFKHFINYQVKERLLDDIDTTILLSSLQKPINAFAHIVIDEAQNWLPEQLTEVTKNANRVYNSVTYVGDIRQRTKLLSIQGWDELRSKASINEDNSIELLKIYRNTKQILQHLSDKGFTVEISDNTRSGDEVNTVLVKQALLSDQVQSLISEITKAKGEVQIGILSKFEEPLTDLHHVSHGSTHIHTLTIEDAQGLEFNTVILIDSGDFKEEAHYSQYVDPISAENYAAQDKHLYYVAATRAEERLIIIKLEDQATSS